MIVPSCMELIHCRLRPQPLATQESASSAMEQAISVRSETPMLTLGYNSKIKDKEVVATWLKLEKAN